MKAMKTHHTMVDFQNMISKNEEVRLAHIAKENVDVVLVDRTIVDNWAYALYNALHGKLQWELKLVIPSTIDDVDLYDRVYYMDTPIKDTTTDQFVHYNDTQLNDMMRDMVKTRYGTKAVLYQNAIVDRDRIIQDVLEFIQK